jgi:hypothetical protein
MIYGQTMNQSAKHIAGQVAQVVGDVIQNMVPRYW